MTGPDGRLGRQAPGMPLRYATPEALLQKTHEIAVLRSGGPKTLWTPQASPS
jgi:hypothetical protein